MDDRILFQTIEGAIQMGLREGAEFISQELPTLRDQFAMSVLNGILAGPCSREGVPGSEWKDAVPRAYELADLMLLARNQTEPAGE